MKRYITLLLLLVFLCLNSESMAQRFRLQSKDSLNERPKWEGYIFFKMKLNGVYDITGGLQGFNTFNLNNIDV